MMDPVDSAVAVVPGPPPPVVPPRGLAGIFDDYDPNSILDTSKFAPGQVFVNVYDLGDSDTLRSINKVSTANNNLLLGGLFHGSVEVYGSEWCYGFTEEDRTGVSRLEPRTHPQHTYRTTVPLGVTQLSEPEVDALMERMSEQWRGNEYNLLNRNCLNFCNALCQELGVGRIPGWVDRAQRVAEGACQTAMLARAVSLEVEQTVRSIVPEVEQTVRSVLPEVEQTVRSVLPEVRSNMPAVPAVDPEEAQRVASEAMQTIRRESLKAMEVVSVQTQELAEVTHAQAQVLGEAVQAHTQALGEKAQELLGDNIAERAQEIGERTQEQARAIGSSLWQWGQDLQKAASRALREESNPQGRINDLWDAALLGVLGGSGEPTSRPESGMRKKSQPQPQQDPWINSELLHRAPVPEQLVCKTGHPLRQWTARSGECDGCGRRVQDGEQVMDCRQCDWYLCDVCTQEDAASVPAAASAGAGNTAVAEAPPPPGSSGDAAATAVAAATATAAGTAAPAAVAAAREAGGSRPEDKWVAADERE